MKLLVGKSIIPQELANRLKGFADFRNILVHEYIKLDKKIVYKALKEDLNHLTEFLKALSYWIKENK